MTWEAVQSYGALMQCRHPGASRGWRPPDETSSCWLVIGYHRIAAMCQRRNPVTPATSTNRGSTSAHISR